MAKCEVVRCETGGTYAPLLTGEDSNKTLLSLLFPFCLSSHSGRINQRQFQASFPDSCC